MAKKTEPGLQERNVNALERIADALEGLLEGRDPFQAGRMRERSEVVTFFRRRLLPDILQKVGDTWLLPVDYARELVDTVERGGHETADDRSDA